MKVKYGKEYALASIYPISPQVKEELGYASEQLGEIFANVVEAIQMMDDQIFLELGIAKDMIAAARMAPLPGITTVIGRFDFAKTNKGWKMLEFNSEQDIDGFPTGAAVLKLIAKDIQALGNVIRSNNFQKTEEVIKYQRLTYNDILSHMAK